MFLYFDVFLRLFTFFNPDPLGDMEERKQDVHGMVYEVENVKLFSLKEGFTLVRA